MEKTELVIAYTLSNRGRYVQRFASTCINFINKHKNFILLIDESDSTDIEYGLDGRKVFEIIKKKCDRKDIEFVLSKNPEVGINYIISKNLSPVDVEWDHFNALNLMFPQGRSEHYKHHRMLTDILLNNSLSKVFRIKGLYIISQHQSAFIRPFSRYLQARKAMKLANKIQKEYPEKLVLLVRDQNTFIPGEGKLERLLRYKNHMKCLTDGVNREYRLDYLEGDTGGLNMVAYKLYRAGVWSIVKKFIAIADKIESFCAIKGIPEKLKLDIKAKHLPIKDFDHGLIYLTISPKAN